MNRIVISKMRAAELLIGLAAMAVVGSLLTAPASADGRDLAASFCSHAVTGSPFPPGLCIQLDAGSQSVQGYYGSPGRISLRPGDYWLTVTDNSNAHNFSLVGSDGLDLDITPVNNGGTPPPVITETVKIHLEPGSYRLLCDNDGHAAAGMEITIDVGGVGQVGQ
jgi:plastocyanin